MTEFRFAAGSSHKVRFLSTPEIHRMHWIKTDRKFFSKPHDEDDCECCRQGIPITRKYVANAIVDDEQVTLGFPSNLFKILEESDFKAGTLMKIERGDTPFPNFTVTRLPKRTKDVNLKCTFCKSVHSVSEINGELPVIGCTCGATYRRGQWTGGRSRDWVPRWTGEVNLPVRPDVLAGLRQQVRDFVLR
jgi:hypothetical protein